VFALHAEFDIGGASDSHLGHAFRRGYAYTLSEHGDGRVDGGL
jgi:hypothetical protein